MSQANRVLNALRAAGPRGIHSNEIRDGLGGSFIANPSQRIQDLEARGHHISATDEKPPGHARRARYVLTFDAEPKAPGQPVPPAGRVLERRTPATANPPSAVAGTLFDTDQFKPKPASPYDQERAA